MGTQIVQLEVDEMPGRQPEDTRASLNLHREQDLYVEVTVGDRAFRVTVPRMLLIEHFGQEARSRKISELEDTESTALLGVSRTPHNPHQVYTLRWYAWKEKNEGWFPYHVGTTPAGEPCKTAPRVRPQPYLLGGYKCPDCGKVFLASWRIVSLLTAIQRASRDSQGVFHHPHDPDDPTIGHVHHKTLDLLVDSGHLQKAGPIKYRINAHPDWDELDAYGIR